MNPVALALYQPPLSPPAPAENMQVLVVCAGTRGVFVHDSVTGNVIDFIRLETESRLDPMAPPLASAGADIVIDEDNHLAFVSCPDTNSVVRIDLSTTGSYTINRTYHLDVGERPGPLLLEQQGDGGTDNRVLVAMTITGNNSVFARGSGVTTGFVAPIPNAVTPTASLPDHDIYLIEANNPANPDPVPLVSNGGSLLFDMERHGSGELWILSSDSDNANIAMATEPLLKGRFVVNQLARTPASLVNPTLSPAGLFTDLDDATASGGAPPTYSDSSSINQARALAIAGDGVAYVASPFLPRILDIGPTGARISTQGTSSPVWSMLESGAQCYDLELMGSVDQLLLAYCLGTMKIEVWNRSTATRWGTLSLGLDPTPDQIAAGRAEFLDGSHSKNSRFSCASCHPGGMSDQLGWMISDFPIDNKDTMLTQSLLSIADTFPHHWRGERDLAAFRGAFRGLLGANPTDVPTVQEMEELIAFMLSLQAPANPLQNPRRVLDEGRRRRLPDSVELTQAALLASSSPIVGQVVYGNFPNANGRTCEMCHQLPTGSDGNMIPEVGTPVARTANMEVAHLRQLQHRSVREVTLPLPFEDTNVNGFGGLHNGDLTSIFRFITQTPAFTVAINPLGLMGVFRFVDQFDQGISPSAQWATRLTQGMTSAELDEAEQILIDGFGSGTGPHNEVIVWGRFVVGPVTTEFRGLLVEGTGSVPDTFVFDGNPAPAPMNWAMLRTLTEMGFVDAMIMGVPLGNSERLAIDFDRDSLPNSLDSDPMVTQDIVPSDPGPPSLLSATLDFTTARVAKYHVQFSEDVVYTVTYQAPGGPFLTYKSVRGLATPGPHDFADDSTFVLTHDHPSGDGPIMGITYAVSMKATDRDGNTVIFQIPPFTPKDAGDHIRESLIVQSVTPVPVPMFPTGMGPPPGFEAFAFEINVTEDDQMTPGQVGFIPADQVMAYFVVTKEAVSSSSPPAEGLPDFELIPTNSADLWTPHPLSFNTVNCAVAGSPVLAYNGIQNYVVSPLTDPSGNTVVVFALNNLAMGADVKISVQGVVRRPACGTQPPPLNLFDSETLLEYAPVAREEAAIGTIPR